MSVAVPSSEHCQRFGFDAEWRAARLALIGLDEGDLELGRRLHREVVDVLGDEVIDQFYEHLLGHAEARHLLDGVDMAHLRETQRAYLDTFGIDFTSQAYFEERLRVGMAHAWVGIPLGLYICAFQILQRLLIQKIEQQVPSLMQWKGMSGFVCKVVSLDMSLAAEIYHRAQVQQLERSLDSLRRERRNLRHAVETDELTGLVSRPQALEYLAKALTASIREDKPLCVAMADLDHFKQVNDTHGHQTGDWVLRDVAARMGSALRDFDMVGRYGGEEFIFVLKDTGLATGIEIAERVRARVGSGPLNLDGLSLQVTISLGLAEAHDGDSVEDIIARADAALYKAKQTERNRVVVAEP